MRIEVMTPHHHKEGGMVLVAKTEFPRTLAAVKAEEGDKWQIADAILAEAGTGPSVLVPMEQFLRTQGFEWDVNTLSRFARTAQNFPRGARHHGVSFEAHIMAVDPETLDEAIRQNDGKPPTKRFVIGVRKAREAEKERLAHETAEKAKAEAEEKAKAEREEADRQRKEADEAKQKAKTVAEKIEARKKAEEAKQAEREAEEAEKKAKRPKGKQNVPDPQGDAVEAIRLEIAFDKVGMEAQSLARKATSIAQKGKGKLDPAKIEDSIASTIEAWEEVRDYQEQAKPTLKAVS